jgi:hypothetical protein
VSELIKYSLVKQNDDAIIIHPLIQFAIRHFQSTEERRPWAERAVRLTSDAFPSGVDYPQVWPKADLCTKL